MNSGQNRKGKPHQGFPIPGPGVPRKDGSPPQQLTDELTARLAEIVPEGGIRPACRRLGVLYETFKTWRKAGERDRLAGIDSTWARLSLAMDKALGEEEARLYRGITEGTVDVRAGTFILERRFDYTQKTTIELDGTVDHTHARQRIQDLFATTVVGTIEASTTPERRDAESDEPRSPLALPSGTEPGGQ